MARYGTTRGNLGDVMMSKVTIIQDSTSIKYSSSQKHRNRKQEGDHQGLGGGERAQCLVSA